MVTSKSSLKKVVAVFVGAAVAAGALSACNTIEGMGKDIKSTGKAIEKTAEEHK